MPEPRSALRRDLNLADADGVYAALVAAHRGLAAAESAGLDARLVLLLANHIGDASVLREAIAAAQEPGRRAGSDPP